MVLCPSILQANMNTEFESDDHVPLADLMPLADTVPLAGIRRTRNIVAKVQVMENDWDDNISDDTRSMVSDDTDNDPEFVSGKWRLKGCKEDIFAACVKCLVLLCYDHSVEDVN